MTLPLDDAQHARHTFRQLSEHTSILREELIAAGFTGPILDKMVLMWWHSLVTANSGPDLDKIMQMLINPEGA